MERHATTRAKISVGRRRLGNSIGAVRAMRAREKERRVLARRRKKIDSELGVRNYKVGEKLRQARVDSGMSQVEVAGLFGRDQWFISRIETGTQRVAFVEVERLLRIYGRTVADFWVDVPKLWRL